MTAADWVMDGVLACVLPFLAWRILVTDLLPKAVVLFIAFGLLSALAWARLDAPDVALVEAAVGAGLTGALLMSALGWSARGGSVSRAASVMPVSGVQRAIIAVVLAAGALVIGAQVPRLPHPAPGLREEAWQSLSASGVSHPVTAVLLNYRGYDTLLEIAVLLVAGIAVQLLRRQRQERAPSAPDTPDPGGPLIDVLLRLLVPGIVLVAGFLLWRGSHAPGGAFQGGAIAAGGAILAVLGGALVPSALPPAGVRAALVVGFAFFLGVAVAPLLGDGRLLEYPRAWAGALILAIESVLTLSIAVVLTTFFPESTPTGGDDEAPPDRQLHQLHRLDEERA